MKKPNLPQFATSIRIGLRKHSSEILTGLGIGGMITTTVMAVSATPKAILALLRGNAATIRRAVDELAAWIASRVEIGANA